ncbi:ABC transporter substrate-binding protein [cf. Phormidesmis sp. LEGE 11477]|uniref:ABC transporter substrate-binding protein n=1 Tax=cf. Phormidesmis sp. LEGE 11477 TaxID=1828680 RepID=UPI00188100B2|nr:ABC transporter substrate-binding protein [cf. Phormidesmis sp. LEGE 11477]MBE9063059.1 amino acid ABC transporter substrate-binding protein [cf. Phormidesmis sp. LEGE 11477]
MAKKNELPTLIAALLFTVALLGGGAWFLINQFIGETGPLISSQREGEVDTGAGTTGSSLAVEGADGSSGQSILPGAASAAKQRGLDALARQDFQTAQAEFSAALQADQNDPESLIYLNNAQIGDAAAHTIAVVAPVGSALNASLEIMRGVAQAQTEINQGGATTPLKVLLLDDKGDPDTAAEVAESLVAEDSVLGVVGHYTSDATLAAAAVYEAGELPMISPTSTAVSISNAGDYIFRTVPSDRLAAATLARYMLNEINQRQAVVFFDSSSAYSRSVKSEFTTELLSNGGSVVADFDISEPGFSAGRALQTAKELGAEVIMLALTADTNDIALQIISVNQKELPMIGGDDMYNFKILDVGRANAQGLVVAVPWHILSYDQSRFVNESRRLWGGDVNWRTVMAYDAVSTLTAAIDQGATREDIATILAMPDFSASGATETVRFLPTGDRNQPSQLVEVVPGNRSGTGFDYVPVE